MGWASAHPAYYMTEINIGTEEKLDPRDLEVVLGNRVFVTCQDPTFEQDLFIIDEMAACGLDRMRERLIQEEKVGKATATLLITAYRSGHLFRLLAGILVEKGKQWSPEGAETNAEFFKNLRDKESKNVLQRQLLGVILTFSFIGSKFEKTLRSFSGLNPNEPPFSHLGIVEAPDTISESGTLSSVR